MQKSAKTQLLTYLLSPYFIMSMDEPDQQKIKLKWKREPPLLLSITLPSFIVNVVVYPCQGASLSLSLSCCVCACVIENCKRIRQRGVTCFRGLWLCSSRAFAFSLCCCRFPHKTTREKVYILTFVLRKMT